MNFIKKRKLMHFKHKNNQLFIKFPNDFLEFNKKINKSLIDIKDLKKMSIFWNESKTEPIKCKLNEDIFFPNYSKQTRGGYGKVIPFVSSISNRKFIVKIFFEEVDDIEIDNINYINKNYQKELEEFLTPACIINNIVLMPYYQNDLYNLLIVNKTFLENSKKVFSDIIIGVSFLLEKLLKYNLYYTDIKPSNILYNIVDKNTIKLILCDLGSLCLNNSRLFPKIHLATYPNIYKYQLLDNSGDIIANIDSVSWNCIALFAILNKNPSPQYKYFPVSKDKKLQQLFYTEYFIPFFKNLGEYFPGSHHKNSKSFNSKIKRTAPIIFKSLYELTSNK